MRSEKNEGLVLPCYADRPNSSTPQPDPTQLLEPHSPDRQVEVETFTSTLMAAPSPRAIPLGSIASICATVVEPWRDHEGLENWSGMSIITKAVPGLTNI